MHCIPRLDRVSSMETVANLINDRYVPFSAVEIISSRVCYGSVFACSTSRAGTFFFLLQIFLIWQNLSEPDFSPDLYLIRSQSNGNHNSQAGLDVEVQRV